VKRTGSFRFNEEGALFGAVRIEFGDIAGADAREKCYLQTREKIEERVREQVRTRLPLAEVTDVIAENADNVLKPFALAYTVSVPGYAERTGQRFIVQPGFFEKGKGALFTADTRASDIYFNYPINEKDDVTMAIPPWFKIEEGSAPDGIDKVDWGAYSVKISLKKKTNEILYARELAFSLLHMAAGGYPRLKNIFNKIHAGDAHTLTLRAGAAGEKATASETTNEAANNNASEAPREKKIDTADPTDTNDTNNANDTNEPNPD